MGVHMLLYWTAAEGAGRREAFDALADAVACLGAAASARWSAQVALLRQAQPQRGADDLPSARDRGTAEGPSLHRVALSDEPEQLFLLSRAAKQVVQAGTDMQAAFLDRLFRQRSGVLLDGTRHSLGDFRICLARVVQVPQQNFLGLAVDIGYLPLDDTTAAAPVLQDMAEVLQEAAAAAGGRLRQVPDSGPGFELPAVQGPRHRAVQYVALMEQLL